MSKLTIDQALTTFSSTKVANIGEIVENGFGDRFMYVKNAGASAAGVAGQLANYMTAGARGEVTMLATEITSGTLGTVTKPAGVFMSAIPAASFGWIQISGHTTTLVTDGGVVDGDYLVQDGGATETFIADTAVAGEEHGVFGLALADDSAGSVVTAKIWCQ